MNNPFFSPMPSRCALLTMAAACLLAASATAAESSVERTRKLVAVLQSDAPFFDKARACQQLGEFGDALAIPALAALLGDEHLAAYARSGLEGIPDPGAAEALRTAAGRLKGPLLAGVVNSIGVLRDAKAVELLGQLATNPASGAAKEALLALGRIGGDQSSTALIETLVKGPEILRPDAAAGCLQAAERQASDGRIDRAAELYDAVRGARVPAVYRAAATRGAIVVRKGEGIPLLIEQLRSSESIVRNAALTAIREIPSDALASALNTEVDRAPAELQVQILTALADCHNPQSLQVLRAKTGSENAEVRRTALAVLGSIGGAREVGTLLAAVAANRSAEESFLAWNSVSRMEGASVDAQIIKMLDSGVDAASRVQFIRLLEARGATNAAAEMLKQASDPEPKVSVAALRALRSLAGPGELPGLIAIARSCRDDTVREAVETAVAGTCVRTGKAAAGSEAVLSELEVARDPRARNSWIRILGSLGDARGLPAIIAAAKDADDSVALNAIEQLGHWPDPAPIDELIVQVRNNPNPARRKVALSSVTQLATAAADERQRPDEMVAKWFEAAGEAAQTAAERRLIISGLGRLRHVESLRLLAPYLDAADLHEEAALAIVQIAPALRQTDPAAVRLALEKIAAEGKNPDLRGRAQKILTALPSEVRRALLFDGKSLAGWEGDTNVWRVRDGVIVGGSLQGNSRNEFLATVRCHTNFVLRLEYRLTGTEGFVNGGVQFRSVRTKQPPNEMSGFQADIGAGYSGCLYDESRRNKMLARPPAEAAKRLERPGEWNRYEVRCAGARIQIALNGEKTVDYTETDAAIPQDGLIALQIHGNCKAEICFRNLSIEELSYGVAIREFGASKREWKVSSFSSENTQAEDERAVLAIDGNPDTFWHTLWNGGSPKHPHHLSVDMAQELEINGFSYLPRQDGRHVKGVVGEYEFYVSRDGNEWGKAVAKGHFERIDQDASGRVVLLPRPVTARYFKLLSLSAPGNEPYAGAAEIDVLGRSTTR